jgi:hypothetical protein
MAAWPSCDGVLPSLRFGNADNSCGSPAGTLGAASRGYADNQICSSIAPQDGRRGARTGDVLGLSCQLPRA